MVAYCLNCLICGCGCGCGWLSANKKIITKVDTMKEIFTFEELKCYEFYENAIDNARHCGKMHT